LVIVVTRGGAAGCEPRRGLLANPHCSFFPAGFDRFWLQTVTDGGSSIHFSDQTSYNDEERNGLLAEMCDRDNDDQVG
jgi:hypothetical protein